MKAPIRGAALAALFLLPGVLALADSTAPLNGAAAGAPDASIHVKTAAVSAAAPSAAAAAMSSDQIVASRTTDRIKDLTTTLVLDDDATDHDALMTMGGAFATTYSFHEMKVSYANPNKARFEGRSTIGPAMMVYNGDQKMFKVPIPFVGRRVENVHGQPGQKQSLVDVGIFARDWLTTDWEPHYMGHQGALDEYRLTQRDSTNGSHEIVFVDPKTYVIVRRLSYNGKDVLKKEMRFRKVVQIKPGIWVPQRIEIFDPTGKLAAAQDLVGTRVNDGVDPSLFDI
jgi:hypothetical protein